MAASWIYLLNIGVTCAILNISGNIPSENMLLNIFVSEKVIGVATIAIYVHYRKTTLRCVWFLNISTKFWHFNIGVVYIIETFKNFVLVFRCFVFKTYSFLGGASWWSVEICISLWKCVHCLDGGKHLMEELPDGVVVSCASSSLGYIESERWDLCRFLMTDD